MSEGDAAQPEIADDNPETGTKIFVPVKEGDPMPQPTAQAQPQSDDEEIGASGMEELFSAANRAPRAVRVNVEAVTEEEEALPALSDESFENPEEFFENLKEKLRENIIEEPIPVEMPDVQVDLSAPAEPIVDETSDEPIVIETEEEEE